jgi:hypothetical protein
MLIIQVVKNTISFQNEKMHITHVQTVYSPECTAAYQSCIANTIILRWFLPLSSDYSLLT